MMRRGRPPWVSICVLIVAVGGRSHLGAAEENKPATVAPGAPGAVVAVAEKLRATPSPEVAPGIFAPKAGKSPPRPSAPSRRALSPEMAAKLGVVVNQAVEALPPPSPRVESGDDSDVVRMDPFRVEEKEAPELKERELRRKKAFDDMAKSLGGSALGGPGIAEAAASDLERQRGREARDLIDLTRIGGSVPSGMKKTIDEMNARVNDPRAQNGTPFKEAQINSRF